MRVDGRIRFEYATSEWGNFESGKKKLRIQKYPDTCGRGLRFQVTAGVTTEIAFRWLICK